MARYMVMVRCTGDTTSRMRSKCLATCSGANGKAHAEELAHRIVQNDKGFDYYSSVKVVEIPDAADNKPYSKKETIYKP